jgi:tape measure domain-containing protein
MAAPELRLKVTLDTSFLKGQISRLPLDFAGANVSIRPKFDRQTIANEFRLLNRYIGSKKFNITIASNLDAEIKNAERLVKALGRVKQAASGATGGLPIGTQVLSRTKTKGGFAAAEIKALFGAAVQGGLIDDKTLASTRTQMVTALGSIGRDSIAGLLNGLKSGDADIQNAAKFLGNNLITSFKTVLGIASPSREFKKIGESAGQGFEQGLLKSIEIAEQSATRKMQRMLDRLARMALMMSGMSGPEIGRQVAQARALPSLNFGATTPRSSVSIGPSSTGRALPPGASRPELPGTAFGRQKYLPTALGEELKEVLRGAANAFLDSIRQNIRAVTITDMGAPPSRQGLLQGGSVAGFLPGRASAASVLELNNILAGAIREYFKSVAREIEYRSGSIGKTPLSTTPLLAQSRVAGLLPQSVGRTPSAYRSGPRESQEQLFARRTREAYINSAARAADASQSPLALPPARDRVLGQPPLMTAPSIGKSRARPMGMTGSAPQRGPSGDGAGSASLFDAAKKTLQLKTVMDVAAASTKNFTASQIPLIGGIKNLAGEFGQAAKQVLLYGTAYKGLAFLTSLPGQILNAAKSQQQFANGLKVATQDTGTFAKELLYVDNVQRAFGLNLETTRTGFTRLYASMAPTGFDSGSIEKLFTGISAATASLQLTPDKAERVIYAFGQMASKGQIMSEELKGQLGDVLPGALAIFSKAAGMSVKEFSKAMEDGEFVGNRFREVFAKVSDELMNRFGTGAQAAGRSLQGLINTVGGDFQRTLESFAPLANSAAQAILGPLGGSLKQLAISAQIATGEIERVFMQLKESQQELKDLRDSAGTDGIITAKETEQIRAAEQNVAALTAKYKSLQQAASDPAIARQAQDITKFTEELGKAGTFVMNVAKAIGGMLSPVLNFLGTNLTTVISLITSFYIGFQTARLAAMALMGVLLLYRTLSAILGFGPAALSANALATAFNGLGIAATGAQVKVIGLRLALTALVASTVIGAVVGGIMLIAGAFASMRDRAKEASQSSRDAAKAAIDAAQTGGVAQAAMSVQTILGESRKSAAARKALEGIMARSTKAQRAGVEPMSLTMEESVALKGSSLTEGMVKPAIGGKPQIRVPSKGDAAAIVRQFGSVAGQEDLNLREAKSALATAQKVAKEVGLNMPTPGATPPEPTGGGATSSGAGAKPKKERESQIPQLTLALEKTKELSSVEMQIVNAQLTSNTTQLSSLELLKRLVEFKYEAKALGLEDLTTEERALKHREIGLRREQAIFESQLQLQIDLKKERDEIQQGFSATLAGYQEEANYQQMYLNLISQGVLPSLAKVRVEAEKIFAEGEKQLNQSIEQQEANIAGLEVTIEALKLEKNLTLEKQEQLKAAENTLETLKEDLRLRGLLKGTAPERKAAAIDAAERGLAPKTAREYMGEGLEAAEERLRELTNTGYQVVEAAGAIGDAFGTAFKGLVSGSMTAQEALAGMFQSIADHFADMVAQMIAEYLKMALIKGIMSIIGGAVGGGFTPLSNEQATSFNFNPGAMTGGTPWTFANGGIAPGGFTAFANGGMVTGPTMGLVGEGRYNEAIVPLPDGKSIPVQLAGGDGGNQIISNITVNVNNGQAQSNATGSNSSEMGRKIEGAVKQVIVGELRPGGLLASKK